MIVGVSAARAQALTAAQQPIPQAQNIRALVDTGASGTCIDPMVFQALGLQPTGTTPMITASTGQTPVDAETYDVSITVPNGPNQPLVIPNMAVSASQLFMAQGFHALLGRDILQRCVLTYNGSMQFFTLAY
jgi:predicted aspartyl protease